MFTLLIFILCFIGWVLNIFKLATDNDTVGVRVFRVIGIFVFPIGVFLGYLF